MDIFFVELFRNTVRSWIYLALCKYWLICLFAQSYRVSLAFRDRASRYPVKSRGLLRLLKTVRHRSKWLRFLYDSTVWAILSPISSPPHDATFAVSETAMHRVLCSWKILAIGWQIFSQCLKGSRLPLALIVCPLPKQRFIDRFKSLTDNEAVKCQFLFVA